MAMVVERDALVAAQQTEIAAQRTEIAGLRAEIVRLQAENSGLGGRIAELERRLGLNSRNSSKPPSSDGPEVPRSGHGKGKGRRGGRDGHEGKGRSLLPAEAVSEYFDHLPEQCRCCGAALGGRDADPERIQTIELPRVRPTVEEHRLHSLVCPKCGAVTKARGPEALRGTLFGPRLHGAVALLGGLLRLSKREVTLALEVLFGLKIGLGSVPKIERRMSAALAAPHEGALRMIRGSPYVHQDSTGWREAKRRANLWITSSEALAHFQITPRANRATAQSILGESFDRPVVTDRAACQVWPAQQWCWSHLLRDFQELVELTGGTWYGDRLRACARRVHAVYADRAAGRITHAEMVAQLAGTRKKTHRLLVNAADHAPAVRARRVCAEILKGEAKLWTFLDHPGVPPTNNPAERGLRKAVLWRKGSFGTDSQNGSRFVERILTVVTSLRLQHRQSEILDWLMAARLAHLAGTAAPSLAPLSATP